MPNSERKSVLQQFNEAAQLVMDTVGVEADEWNERRQKALDALMPKLAAPAPDAPAPTQYHSGEGRCADPKCNDNCHHGSAERIAPDTPAPTLTEVEEWRLVAEYFLGKDFVGSHTAKECRAEAIRRAIDAPAPTPDEVYLAKCPECGKVRWSDVPCQAEVRDFRCCGRPMPFTVYRAAAPDGDLREALKRLEEKWRTELIPYAESPAGVGSEDDTVASLLERCADELAALLRRTL